ISDYLPVSGTKRNGNSMYNEGKTKEEAGLSSQVWIVDHDYLKTMGIKLLKGRNFSPDFAGDSMAAVINKTLADRLGIKEPDGRRITNGWELFTVVGIVEDFNFESMRQKIDGLVLRPGTSPSMVSVKMTGADMGQAIPAITAVWKKFSPNQSIRYSFLDEKFASMYRDVQ